MPVIIDILPNGKKLDDCFNTIDEANSFHTTLTIWVNNYLNVIKEPSFGADEFAKMVFSAAHMVFPLDIENKKNFTTLIISGIIEKSNWTPLYTANSKLRETPYSIYYMHGYMIYTNIREIIGAEPENDVRHYPTLTSNENTTDDLPSGAGDIPTLSDINLAAVKIGTREVSLSKSGKFKKNK